VSREEFAHDSRDPVTGAESSEGSLGASEHFRTADIHETVPPLLAMALVWEMTLVDLFTGAYAGVPGPLRVLLVLGAPVSVTAVGLWELRRLRAHYGIAVRDMLMRQAG
jgi:hypothetical protein